MCKCTPANRSCRYCGATGCDSRAHLLDALAMFPERERSHYQSEEAALCIEMLAQRNRSLSAGAEATRTADAHAQRTLVKIQAQAAFTTADKTNRLHRRAQEAEGRYHRLLELLLDVQACVRLSGPSAENAARRLLGFDFKSLPTTDEAPSC